MIQQYKAANTPAGTGKQIAESMTIHGAAAQPLTEQQRRQGLMTQQSTMSQLQQQKIESQRVQAMTVQPQASLQQPNTSVSSLSRAGVLARGVEGKEGESTGQSEQGSQTEAAETSVTALLAEGTPDILEQVTVTLDSPLHFTDAKGEVVELKPGVYEIAAVLDVQLGLAKEQQSTVLLNVTRNTHSIQIDRSIAVLIPGPSNDMHLLFLTPDGRRFDAHGSISGVKSRSPDVVTALPDQKVRDAIHTASTQPRSVSPACQQNPADTGPRWLPVPCTLPEIDHP